MGRLKKLLAVPETSGSLHQLPSPKAGTESTAASGVLGAGCD